MKGRCQILYISDINYYKKQARIYLFLSIFTFIFSFIYELFSHNVYSLYMLLSPFSPLLLGTFINYILYFSNINIKFSKLNVDIHNSFVLTLTLYMLLNGVLYIYGTTNKLLNYYIYILIFLLILNILVFMKNIICFKK